MIEKLQLVNFPSATSLDEFKISSEFVMKTCQRTLILSVNPLPQIYAKECERASGNKAYQYLLEVILGIKSKVIAENEIVSQFREAFKDYVKTKKRNSILVSILEKLFKDSKKIRREHLLGVGQKTYAGIARKLMLTNKVQEILVIGSGNLAIDVINQFKKRDVKVFLTARNSSKLNDLCKEHCVEIFHWNQLKNPDRFSHIINTVGTNDVTLFDETYFNKWICHTNRLFIDLGYPSVLKTDLTKEGGVIKINDVFELGALKEKEKIEKIEKAKIAIKQAAQHRELSFSINFPFGWEDLNFV